MPITKSSNYGSPNFKQPMVAIGSKKLDEEAEAAREKAAERGLDALSWKERWLLGITIHTGERKVVT